MIHRTGCTPICMGCAEPLKGVHRSRFIACTCTPICKAYAASLKGVNPSIIRRTGCTPICMGCAESLKGVHPSMIHCMHVYTHLQSLCCILEGCKPLYDSPHGEYTHLQDLR